MNRDTVFYNYMTPEQQDLLNRSMQQASFRKGQIVHRHGDSCVGLIFVRKGRLAFSILSEEGRERGRSASSPPPASCAAWSLRVRSQQRSTPRFRSYRPPPSPS